MYGKIRFLALFAAAIFGGTATHAAPPPSLIALTSGFQVGLWSVSAIGDRAGTGQNFCITAPERLLTRGRATNACNFTVITNTKNESVVTYRCAGGLSGRTALRRDMAGLYTIEAQGIENGMPFASRTEWRRVGNC